jgi:phage gp36-like protein
VSYIAQADLDEYISETNLIQLTDDDRTGAANAGVVTECISGSEDEVNGYLSGLYTVPIVGDVPGIVTESCVVLACRRLYLRRGGVPESFQSQVDDTISLLTKIAEGKIKLDIDGPTADFGSVEVSTVERVNSRKKWSGW